MSIGRLILAFKDGVSLALNEDKMKSNAVIEVGQNFSQAGLDYKEDTWTVINQEESRGDTVMKINNSGPHTMAKKRKIFEEAESSNKLKSMVATQEGRLVSAGPAEIPEKRKATLTPTQRRNKNRQIRKMLLKLNKQNEEETPTVSTITAKPEVPEAVAPRKALKSVIVETQPEDITMDDIPEEIKNIGARAGVEPYIPQYISRPRPLQIVSEHEIEKFQRMERKTFRRYERVQGREINILEGLELYEEVFSYFEQKEIEQCVFDLRDKGRAGLLRGRTYSEPNKWKPGKGRITIQCGCCYNFAKDREGNPPGILRHDEVEPLPPVIKRMIKKMVSWKVLPVSCIPNSCIINIYEEGDCIPPHIDHHDFVRPFSTVSFVNECDIMFGTNLRIAGPGKFDGPVKIPLPVGSVLVLQGNGADVAKHCIPGVPVQRISVTFRRMDDSKMPYRFRPDPELESLQPLEL